MYDACLKKIARDKKPGKQEKIMGKYGKWSRDWEQFNWEPIDRELKEVVKDNGADNNIDVDISREEVIEYFEWLSENRPEEFWAFLIFRKISESGL